MPLRLSITSKHHEQLGDGQCMEFKACGGTIGRNIDNDWVLPDPKLYVSGRHALIDFQSGAYYLIDTSRNGVYINGADEPVGRGHPQRLFNDDRLRIGDFDIQIELTEDDESQVDDGLCDSIIRAQLVPEDDSVELMLVDENKMIEDEALAQHLKGDGASQLSERIALANLTDPASSKHIAEDKAVGLLLEAAGLKPGDLEGTQPSEVLQLAGQLLQGFVNGLTGLIHERTHLKDTFRLPQTLIQGKQNNPLKFSPTTADALKYLLGNDSESYLPALEAVRVSFQEIQQHERAVPRAMMLALKEFLERFDPEELSSQFDQGLKRSALLSGTNKLKYWELYQECFHVLTQAEDGKVPEVFSNEFARAYEHEVETLKATRST
ncbi:MAG: type VI secretion system-associated FHA domain protein TagH [Gammaproteobacteria bacterium]|jgi:type VI secretion system protein ImpI|nr:type VI secretion system-associated FHA domain protein TagH [Chromatiales bacterium]MDP6675153.1 type VI secretion system-associated FHA domain protein TagH [Gammaproteobacteria bacterium]